MLFQITTLPVSPQLRRMRFVVAPSGHKVTDTGIEYLALKLRSNGFDLFI
jgi:hypothetical protein